MTKSRTLPTLCVLLLSWSPAAAAQAPALRVPPAIIVAPPNPLGDLAARRLADEARCREGAGDAIVVCGLLVRGGGGYRIPYVPEPGATVRLIAGELPSATGAMGADRCIRLCEQPVTFNLFDPGSIARGFDRILGGPER